MRLTIRPGALCAAAIFALPACSPSAIPHPIPVGSNTPRYGRLQAGEKFSVAVGAPRAVAQDVLIADGFVYDDEFPCAADLARLIECQADDRFDIYRSFREGRYGSLFVQIDEDEVVAMNWTFQQRETAP